MASAGYSGAMLMERGLGADHKVGQFTKHQDTIILAVSMVAAGLSLLMAGVALYWFARMKRTFRHHLILLLIMSDVGKALWYFIFPIIIFSHHKISNDSAFCQIQGFLLAAAIEASDFAILAIAFHAALFIFKPPQKLGQGGLYAYRKYVYPLWIAFPLLAASLAFTRSNGDAYVNAVTFCYLPKRPFWYRLALSWIPRYVIFIIIFIAYGAIYIYVHRKFRGFEDLHVANSALLSPMGEVDTSQDSEGEVSVSESNGEAELEQCPVHTRTSNTRPEWDSIDFITASPIGKRTTPKPTPAGTPTGMPHEPIPGTISADFAKGLASTHAEKPRSGMPAFNRAFSAATTLGPENSIDTIVNDAAAPQVVKPLQNDNMAKTRIAIQRQLRFMFIYPLVYIVLWLIPFINHCLQYSDYFTAHPPFWLQVLASVSLAIQAGADATVFSWRERPWRRVRSSSKSNLTKVSSWTDNLFGKQKAGSVHTTRSRRFSSVSKKRPTASANWWELEAKMRKDSVLMDDDQLTKEETRDSHRSPASSSST